MLLSYTSDQRELVSYLVDVAIEVSILGPRVLDQDSILGRKIPCI